MSTALYKSLKPEHAHKMLRSGEVRVGTLFEFRKLEGSDRERGDRGEGKLLLHSDAGRRVYNSTAELPPVLRNIQYGPGGLETEGENAFVFEFDGPDMLIYCVSEIFDKSTVRDLGGACVRITKPNDFFRALDDAVRAEMASRDLRVGPMSVDRCSYIERRHDWHGDFPASWVMSNFKCSAGRRLILVEDRWVV